MFKDSVLLRHDEFWIITTKEPCNRATKNSFGYDIRTPDIILLHPNETHVVATGVHVKMDDDVMAMVCSRSGLSVKGIVVANAPGIIDSDYRDEIKVILHNHGNEDVLLGIGDKIAQLVFVKALRGADVSTQQRNGGLGSTGA